jgi:hypothetical protein
MQDAHDWFKDADGEAEALIVAIILDANGEFTSQQKARLQAASGKVRAAFAEILAIIDEKLVVDKRDLGPPVI